MLETKAVAARMTPEHDRAWHKEIEDILVFLELSERGVNCPDPMFFDGVFPCTGPLLERLKDRYYGGMGAIGRRMDALADSLPRIAGGVVTSDDDGVFLLTAARSMDFEAKRRLLAMGAGRTLHVSHADGPWYEPGARIGMPIRFSIMDRMVDIRTVKFHAEGLARSVYRGVMARDGKTGMWVPVGADKPLSGDHGYGSMSFALAVALAVEKQRSWTVAVRYQPDRPGVGLVTDPVGIREFFRFRDLAPGKSRRDALLHWVTNHWRQDRLDPEAEVFVREYMRGKSRFHWHNLTVDVAIPEPDVMRLEAATRDRKRPSPDRFKRKRKKTT